MFKLIGEIFSLLKMIFGFIDKKNQAKEQDKKDIKEVYDAGVQEQDPSKITAAFNRTNN
jgi:hypothetical protein